MDPYTKKVYLPMTETGFYILLCFQWKEEGQYLSRQQEKGWERVRVSGLGLYHFCRCQPKKVVYQLDYNPEGIAHREEYLQMFRDCGWEYLQDYAGYSHFRKPVSEMEGEQESIFCDDESRLDMMNRIFKGRMVPLLVIFSVCFCLRFFKAACAAHPGGMGCGSFSAFCSVCT